MTRYVAFLRAINVGRRVVKMDALRAAFVELGVAEVETFIASGNVIFSHRSSRPAPLEAKIENHLRRVLGYEVATFVRTAGELAGMAAYAPFPAAEVRASHALYAGLIHKPLSAAQQKTLAGLASEVDAFHAHGREVYWLCRVSSHQSTFSGAVFERLFKGPSTWRNVKTLQRMAARLDDTNTTEGGRRKTT
jgi:uncharacterized protein (DUF1697 family)